MLYLVNQKKFNKKCGHLDRPFKERTNFVMEQFLLKTIVLKYLNKPIYIGTNILHLSKVLIQDFHYDYIKSKYGDQVEVFLADTDSIIDKMKLKMFMKNSTRIISYLVSVIIKKI